MSLVSRLGYNCAATLEGMARRWGQRVGFLTAAAKSFEGFSLGSKFSLAADQAAHFKDQLVRTASSVKAGHLANKPLAAARYVQAAAVLDNAAGAKLLIKELSVDDMIKIGKEAIGRNDYMAASDTMAVIARRISTPREAASALTFLSQMYSPRELAQTAKLLQRRGLTTEAAAYLDKAIARCNGLSDLKGVEVLIPQLPAFAGVLERLNLKMIQVLGI